MRIRVPVGVRNRLVRLEGNKPVNLPIGGWPPIMGLDEWEVLASRMQDELCGFSQQDTRPAPKPVPVIPSVRKADDSLGEQVPAIEGYLEAQRKEREERAARKA